MTTSIPTRRRLAVLATACLLSVALPASAAWAQKTKDKGTSTPKPSVTSSEVSVDIPAIDAIQSNVDNETLRAIFSGDLVDNADALAGLTATSITIPEITVDATTTVDGNATTVSITFSDLVLSDVTDGVADSFALAGMSIDGGEDGSGEFGPLSASNFSIGGVLGMYGLVDAGGQTELKTIYSDFHFDGGTITSPEAECTIGAMTAAEFKARPLSYSFAEIVALGEALETQDGDPSPQTIGKALRMYADLLTAFESSPVEFGGFDCSGVDDQDRPVSVTVAGMTVGGMAQGVYPAVSVDGIEISVEGDGAVSIGNTSFKSIDLTGPIATILSAPEAIDEAWFMENARALVPAFAGFSFADIAVDVPDPENDGERITASIGSFDLTLGNYFNGIPTDLLTSARNVVVDLPEDSGDEQIQQLLALGVTAIDAGFTIDASWNEADSTIVIDEVSLTGADLATVSLAGTIANATASLFATDEEEMSMAAMGVAIANLKLDVTDAGLSDLILKQVSADQGSDAATMRPVFAGLAEGTIISFLAGAAEAQKVGGAVSAFVGGKAKQLTIELVAKEAPGLGLVDFMAAEEDPTLLIGKVTIDATAK